MRQDQWSNTLTVNGKHLGVWDTMAGGDVQFSETKYAKGGLKPERSLGGKKSVNNVTLGRLLEKDDGDDWDIIRTLMQATNNSPATVSRQPLDEDGKPFGKPLVFHGLVLQIMPGDTDANNTGAQVWQIIVSTHASVG